ncbi:NAD-dependent succinate-semialdehyde dehydrogenase [Naasia lichenicola]|uniref:NAD-dependent succinate-semialdehyde dehydrogenase n=1 Tax=Naasia lichenicola TaxID=2565933 RepID=A0A4S4FMQ0_9MICO|nr:NAD-dependent succinate-semialdehyde dehydrogenase [Naasia lichenicola]THG31528.1 NAD-dependent succinate-semialdehyde dehydrogenase [Naasia lichenicola]
MTTTLPGADAPETDSVPELTAAERDALSAAPTDLLLDGTWTGSSTGGSFPVEDPSTGATLAHVADASEDDARRALDTAVRVQGEWGRSAPRERSEILRRTYELMMADIDRLSLLMTLEMGKPLAESRAEVAYAADYFRWFAEEAVRFGGRFSSSPDGAARILTLKQPVGPVLLVTPWNFPLAMAARKVGPAIAAGCTVIVKAAKQTPLSMHAVARIMQEAGLPAGVLSLITTSRSSKIVSAIIDDPRLRKLSFTGSTEVGRVLIQQSAASLLRVSMELGGNAPFIVFDDADIEHAADQAMLAKLRNNGEACTAANRFLVHSSVVEQFSAALVERFERVRVGRGSESGVTLGPLIDRVAVDKVQELVDAAVEAGATVAYRGEVPTGPGHWSAPTVLTGVGRDSRVVTEEIFGPVAPIVAFDTDAEAMEIANSSEYGLASYVFTADERRARWVYERLESGMVGLNRGVLSNPAAPFGGIKASGFGREGGSEGIDEYLEIKYVAMNGV